MSMIMMEEEDDNGTGALKEKGWTEREREDTLLFINI